MINFDLSKFDFSNVRGVFDASVYIIEETYRYTCGGGWFTLWGTADHCKHEGIDLNKRHCLMIQDYSDTKKAMFKSAYHKYDDALNDLYEKFAPEENAIHKIPVSNAAEHLQRCLKRFEYTKKLSLEEAKLYDKFAEEIENIIKEN